MPQFAIVGLVGGFPDDGANGVREEPAGFRSNLEAMKAMAYCVYREDEFFVAQCLNVDVSSFGATREEAFTNLKEAVDRWALRAAHVALTMCSQSATLFG